MKKIILAIRRALIPLERIRNYWRRQTIINIPEYGQLVVRKNTSDESVFWQVFVEKEYDFSFKIKPKLIIDGGANIGCTTFWFKNKFPEAQIVAVEPEESNFKILEQNVGHLPGVKLLRAGIWNENTNLQIKDPGLGKWGFETQAAEAGAKNSFPAVTIDKILADSGMPEIDILKLDVEGAEKEIFGPGCESWLSRTKVLIIELHEYLRLGVKSAFYSAIAKYDFKKFKKGEKIILLKNEK
jgi:FkbM family methyltransferase